jgi:GMP synthase (glutamine-hydrolysing)
MIDHLAEPTDEHPSGAMRVVGHEQANEPIPRVLVIEHELAAGPGRVGQWLSAEGVVLEICRPYAGETVPEWVKADGLLVLGGSVGPEDDVFAPWLPATRALLRRAVQDAVPTWGICLGGQLLAAALGGDVRRGANGPEVGVLALDVDAGDDPVFGGLPARTYALQFHQDAVTRLPEAAVRLASNSAYENQVFRVGSCAWGVQFHPEVTTEDVQVWARDYPHVVTAGARDGDQVVEELAARQDELEQTWAPVTRRWAAQVRKRAAQRISGPACR